MINQPRLELTLRDKDLIMYEWLRPSGKLESLLGQNAIQFRDDESGYAFLELIAGLSDVSHTVTERDIQETNIITAREIQNVFDLAAARGYFARLATGATIPVRLRFTNYSNFLPIPAGFQVATNGEDGEQVIFETEVQVNKPTGPSYIDITFVQGESVTEEPIQSTGNIKDRIALSDGPVIHDSAVVLVDGTKWDRVETFINSDPTSQHYRIVSIELVPDERQYFIQFGNNTFGKYPPVGTQIQISYRRGGGKIGNVPKEILTEVLSDLVAPDGTSVNVVVEGLDDGEGGLEEELVDEIRLNAYIQQITNQRSVSLQDYELAARVAGGVKRAVALTYNQNSLLQINTVYVVICDDLVTPPDQSRRDFVKTAIQAAYPQGDAARLLVIACKFKDVAVSVKARLRKGAVLGTRTTEIQSVVDYALSIDGLVGIDGSTPRFFLDIEKELDPSFIEKPIGQVRDVVSCRVQLDGDDEPVTPGTYEIIRASSISYDIAIES